MFLELSAEKENAPGPGEYSDARPGAFNKSQSSARSNTGFGGTSSRVTAFEQAANRAASNASSHLSYDVRDAGSFAKDKSAGSSAAFASKSSQRSVQKVSEGPSAGSYDTSSVNSLASGANKSFNKSLAAGTGGFGTSAKRCSQQLSARGADAPGPGEYQPAAVTEQRSKGPSSAFASTTAKAEPVRPSADTSASDYDPHAADGMAAHASKSFNRNAGTSAFGPRSARQIHERDKLTPAVGEYDVSDPIKPTLAGNTQSSRGKATAGFASTTLRDPSQWGKGFLP